MCKVLFFTNGSKLNKDLDKLILKASKLMSITERDGFGFCALGQDGVFGQKTINKIDKLNYNSQASLIGISIPNDFKFGNRSDVNGPVLFHGRTSTNEINIVNTHPIIKDDWYLIHNGVVSNKGPDYNMLTSNDTEHLLHYLSTDGIEGIEKNVSGYYAVAAISPDNRLHVIKDDMATLFVSWCSTLESFIFATTEEMIKSLSRDMKWKSEAPEQVINNIYLIFNQSGQLEYKKDIIPLGIKSYYEVDNKCKSLKLETRDVVDTFEHDMLQLIKQIEPQLDPSYHIFDIHGNEITIKDFIRLDDKLKLDYEIILPDGRSMFDYAG